jgi:hypothetical protein
LSPRGAVVTLQRPEETAAAEAAITDAAAEAEANEPGQQAQAPLQPIYALYPVEWRGDRQTVADEPAAEVEPLSIHDVWRVVNLMARMARDAAPERPRTTDRWRSAATCCCTATATSTP